MNRCQVQIGPKGQKQPCGLPARSESLCVFHLAARMKEQRKSAR